MSNRHPIKETVKILYITKPNQKIRFQIRHPENVHSIIGIAVTCSLSASRRSEKLGTNITAGNLHLAIAEKGDVAFTEDVKIDNNDYLDISEKQVFNILTPKDISTAGKRQSYFETNYKITDAIIEGYYEDFFLSKYGYVVNTAQLFSEAIPVKGKEIVIIPKEEIIPIRENQLYKVTIYLRYQTLKPCEHEH